jgi:hypothetical protein
MTAALALAVDAAHWPFPLGWAYANLTGNVTADMLFGAAGFLAGRVGLRNVHARLDAQDQQLAGLHDKHDRLHAHLGVAGPDDAGDGNR